MPPWIPDRRLFGAMTLEQAVANGFAASRTGVAAAKFFGLLALLIASIGLYAVVARSVTDRTREMGVRIALGLTPRQRPLADPNGVTAHASVTSGLVSGHRSRAGAWPRHGGGTARPVACGSD